MIHVKSYYQAFTFVTSISLFDIKVLFLSLSSIYIYREKYFNHDKITKSSSLLNYLMFFLRVKAEMQPELVRIKLAAYPLTQFKLD